jgi:TM2 domain-containing membrane protein YozV
MNKPSVKEWVEKNRVIRNVEHILTKQILFQYFDHKTCVKKSKNIVGSYHLNTSNEINTWWCVLFSNIVWVFSTNLKIWKKYYIFLFRAKSVTIAIYSNNKMQDVFFLDICRLCIETCKNAQSYITISMSKEEQFAFCWSSIVKWEEIFCTRNLISAPYK